MKVTLVDIVPEKETYINKDVMGGFGEATNIGNSFPAKLIQRAKKKGIKLPLIDLAYLASILRNNGHEVSLNSKDFSDSDLVVIHSSIVGYKSELELADEIRKKGTPVGFIGPFSSFKPELFLEHANFIVAGEPEEVFFNLKNEIPKGLVKSRPQKNLDSLPKPYWDIFPVGEYSYYPAVVKKPFLPILSSRGCCLTCNYCPYKAYYGDWRQRSVANIIEELKLLKENYGINGLLFRDPLFTVNKKRVMEIAEGILKNKLDFEWACETHFEYLDKELIDTLYESGLRSINVGIESYDEEILTKATRKFAAKKHQEEIIKYCDKKGIKIAAFYILGLPDDTLQSIEQTIRYAKKLNTFLAQFFICTPFPGTEFYRQVEDKIFEKDWEKFDSFTPVFQHKHLKSNELLALKEKAFVSYYFRPRWLLKYARYML